MIEAARVRSADSNQTVQFVLGNAYPLPFDSGSFDGCRADRLLQHLDDPEHAVAEFFRVLRTHGRCVVADVDWGTLTVTSSFPALTRQILTCGSDLHRNGWAARGFYGQFRSAGFLDIQCEPAIARTTEWDIASWAFGLDHYATEAAKRRLISQDERHAWLGDVLERDSAGTFFSSIRGITVSGRRP
jgi:SAM-dependent methyltransferase